MLGLPPQSTGGYDEGDDDNGVFSLTFTAIVPRANLEHKESTLICSQVARLSWPSFSQPNDRILAKIVDMGLILWYNGTGI